jgi:hypothetical protein
MSFNAWICPLLKPYYLQSEEYLYFEGDEVLQIYFIKQGTCSFVLPKYNNIEYIAVNTGSLVGVEDILASIIMHDDLTQHNWANFKNKIIRHFTIVASSKSLHHMYLTLSINDTKRL